MEIHLVPEQQSFVDELIRTGRFDSVEAAIAEGVRLLRSNEELRHKIQLGIEQADRGELIDHDTVFTKLHAIAIGEDSVNA